MVAKEAKKPARAIRSGGMSRLFKTSIEVLLNNFLIAFGRVSRAVLVDTLDMPYQTEVVVIISGERIVGNKRAMVADILL